MVKGNPYTSLTSQSSGPKVVSEEITTSGYFLTAPLETAVNPGQINENSSEGKFTGRFRTHTKERP
jgi:hypothetical protein